MEVRTTISQTIPRGSLGDVQRVVTAVGTWSQSQLMQLNADKCKELIIDFKENPHNFSPLVVDSKALPVIDCAKILGVTISSDLKWNNHVVDSDCIKKANKRIHFIVLLKRARVPCNDIVNFYCTTIRSVLEYCTPLFHHALPAYLKCFPYTRLPKFFKMLTEEAKFCQSLGEKLSKISARS